MGTDNKIIWLASYPKSGNTWFRVFLTNLLGESDRPADINDLYSTTIASSRSMFDEATGLSSSDLMPEEIEQLRPHVYRYIAQNSKETLFHKIHDAWTTLPDGSPLVPPEITQCVLYFIRNPLDVAVSFAHHSSVPVGKSIGMMNDRHFAFCGSEDRLHNQTKQQLLTWSGHVESWVDQSGLNVMVLRYEDMLSDTFEMFKKAVEFAGIKKEDHQIKKAIEFSSFENLKKQESEKGFREKALQSESFFRKGKAGDWKNVLTPEQVNTIIGNHKKVMKRFGYL
jgi:hypothetical protein